ncbi:flagellar hook-associated protein FlgK [Ideonella paludis]|uniref:Flagellar hook-associated protein 1 n=2 Tax=Ideonella paludis TaxID=1233411 RepID=A0ABS5E2U0_9BURK|nr:flagellar hook-associated protein FlgK [Ideonella paludis]
MSIGMRAMFASTASLQSTSHNIANANVAGYSRQETEVATSKGQFSGAGFYGKGVDVVNVRRAHDRFLTMQAAVATSMAKMDEARQQQLVQLEDVFPPGEQGLGYAMGDFFASMTDLANSPSDNSARQVVLARAADVADRFAGAANRIDILQRGVVADLESSAISVNSLAARIADLNDEIAGYAGLNQLPNDLLDQRDSLIKELSGFLQVTTLPASDGTVGIFIAGGQRLVLGAEASQIKVKDGDPDPSMAALVISTQGQELDLNEDTLAGGSMAGLINFQNHDLVDARNMLGQMAAAFAGKVNEAQSRGLDLGKPPGPGVALFRFGGPEALASRFNARDGSGQLLASVSMTVTDPTQLAASDYDLRLDAAGGLQLTRLSDGLVRTINSGDVVDGMRVDVGGLGLQPGDRYTLQPVGRAAQGMQRALDDTLGLAAASPVTATFGVGNTGTASLRELLVTGTPDTQLITNISFTSDSGDYTWELIDRDTGALVNVGTGTWNAGEGISLNGFSVTLNGVPKTGDSITVDKTLFPGSNNGNALAMSSLADDRIVGMTLDSNGSPIGGRTATDAYAAAMADIGVRVQSSKLATNISAAASEQADRTLASKTGVNLDEEASRLIQFQQSYQAAAKVLQVAQSVFDTMLQLGT